jgi:predicted dehydrogenase
MADLTTFLHRRIEPAGPQATFGGPVREGRPRQIDTEDCATMLLRFEGGARGAFTVSQVSPGRKNSLRYEVDGSRAAAAWDSERPDELWIGHRDQPNQLLMRDPNLMDPAAAAVTRLPAGHAEGFADGFRGLHEAVYDAIAAGGPPGEPRYPTFADGHEEMLIGDAILRSAALGAWVDVQRPAEVTE